jgi:hypothetical protein
VTRRVFLAAVMASAIALSGCGAAKGTATGVSATLADGSAVASLGFGAEGGEKPAILHRAKGGYVLAYAGTRSGDRKIYLATSPDGARWGKARAVAAAAFSDQAPALAEDAEGRLHLFFASNRSGEAQGLYHAVEQGGAFAEAREIPGFEGCQDVAVAASDKGLTVVAEVMGAGILAATAADGTTFAAATEVVPAGAEPAACTLPDGRTLVAYQAEGKIWFRAGKPGGWEAPLEAATGASRLRDPGLAWHGDAGTLVYTEKGEAGYGLIARSFDSSFRFTDAEAPAVGSGDARGAAIAVDHNGSKTFAWGMKTANGQQGVMVSTR